ncbi:hypothetical protein COV49_01105 [Candidatus Falkowbacteria bacterium CG11_big_fil_rev_8_21_14_0_20_39_10]|uniref:O-antigen ligase-related domain-containing protein n=1 Tax=Candidatus Falkowbacteria bacterium CG11_big_fil_rev_8_21_14_0_20_39_10 TaxID=1974570 RepID=A0A2M6KA40_9BACT|nr:MAG: hypothetical protein COV49_01105 [Candidatus Falkowbacteria bacterium CG11_big_fil_rev_8_21_14_0_20_39_10]
MSTVLIILFLIFYLILAYIRLDLAVLAMIVLLPSYLVRFSILGVPTTLLEGMILISFAVWFIKNCKQLFDNIKNKLSFLRHSVFDIQHSTFKRYPFDIEIILLLIVSYLSVAGAGFSISALGIWKAYFFEPALVFILIFNILRKKEFNSKALELNSFAAFEKILWAFVLSALGVSLLAIYQKFTGAWITNEFWSAEATRRVTSFFGYPNAVGLYLGPIIIVLIGWLSQKIGTFKKPVISYWLWVNGFIFLTIISSIAAIWFAKSKGALLGIGAGLIVFALLAGKKSKWATIIILIILGGGILGYAPARNTAYNKLIYSKSWQIRKAGWQETWAMLAHGRIFSGAGLTNYQEAVKPCHQEGIFYNDGADPDFHRHTVFNADYRARVWQPLEVYLYPHNIFLNFWSELGLAGMLLFIWIIGKYVFIGLKRAQESKEGGEKFLVIGLVGAMVVIIVHGQVDVPYFKNDLAVMFWILIALMEFLRIRRQES